MAYEFQWGGAHTLFSIYDRSCRTYGPYVFGSPQCVDYVAFGEKGHVDAYISDGMAEEWKAMSSRMLEPDFAEKLLAQFSKAYEENSSFYAAFKQKRLDALSSAELFLLLEELCALVRKVGVLFSATQQYGTQAVEDELRNRLRGQSAGNADAMFSLLTMPSQPDIISREQADLAVLASREFADDDLLAHAEKHAWLLYQTYDSRLGFEFLKRRAEAAKDGLQAKAAKEKESGVLGMKGVPANERVRLDGVSGLALNVAEAAKRGLREKQETVFRGLDAETIRLCLLLQELAHQRLELKDVWAGAEWRFLPLLKQIAKRSNLAVRDIMYAYTLAELKVALLEGKALEATVVKNRKEAYAVQNLGGVVTLYEKGALPALKERLGIADAPAVSEVTGSVANPGFAKGRAYVVRVMGLEQLAEDEKNFKDGDIFVTTMTQPSHASLVQRSAAVVADEGGVSSHASVIAREFNKPCIVGAKIATRVFKTGDLIEVDATQGIVRKL